MSKMDYSPPPMPKWIREMDLNYKVKPSVSKSRKKSTSPNPPKKKSLQKVKTASEVRQCSCAGDNDRCFKCDGTGFYRAKVVINLEQCQEKIQQRKDFGKATTPEVQFSNDMRGSAYGVRELGRFSSLPLREES